MEECPSIHMERTTKIARKSVHVFLKNYHYFTTTAAFLVLPVSLALLLWQALAIPSVSPLMTTFHARLDSLFGAAGFPTSHFFSFLSINMSQTICSSIFALPFSLSFLLLGKAAVIRRLCHKKSPVLPPFSSVLTLYPPLISTQVCNLFVVISANASLFFFFFLAFNSLEILGFTSNNLLVSVSVAGAVLYSVILANTLITCNLALIVAGMENCGGYLAILKACVFIKGSTSTAISLALPINIGLAAIEALFQFRVVRAYRLSGKLTCSIAFEGLLVAYLYSLFVVIDTITTCMLYKSCKSKSQIDEGRYYVTEVTEEDGNDMFKNSKTFHELP